MPPLPQLRYDGPDPRLLLESTLCLEHGSLLWVLPDTVTISSMLPFLAVSWLEIETKGGWIATWTQQGTGFVVSIVWELSPRLGSMALRWESVEVSSSNLVPERLSLGQEDEVTSHPSRDSHWIVG